MGKIKFNKSDIIILATIIFISIYILFYGYYGYVRITWDSIKYLRSAEAFWMATGCFTTHLLETPNISVGHFLLGQQF